MKIDIFGFIEDTNIGDPVIGETCKYLVEYICKKNNIDAEINIHPLFPPPSYEQYPITRFLRKQCRKPRNLFSQIYTFLIFKLNYIFGKTLKPYYKKCIKNSDLVIFAGGGMLKYVSQEFWASDYCILDYCKKHKIPVYFNAVGIEGYNGNNFISKLLKKLMNYKCIKGITTRDDVDALCKYLNKKNCSDLVVGDPALYSKELYQALNKTEIIGINMIRPGIFRVNGHNTSDEEVLNFYVEMIKRLDKNGYNWQIFTNGADPDYDLGLEVLKSLNIEPTDKNIVPLPHNSIELVKTISQYKAVIAGRMHAHIIATSFDIPTIGMIWNDKIKWFAKHISAEERFFTPEEMSDYDNIFSKLEKALSEGNSKLRTEELKQKTFISLENIINSVIK